MLIVGLDVMCLVKSTPRGFVIEKFRQVRYFVFIYLYLQQISDKIFILITHILGDLLKMWIAFYDVH